MARRDLFSGGSFTAACGTKLEHTTFNLLCSRLKSRGNVLLKKMTLNSSITEVFGGLEGFRKVREAERKTFPKFSSKLLPKYNKKTGSRLSKSRLFDLLLSFSVCFFFVTVGRHPGFRVFISQLFLFCFFSSCLFCMF